MSRTRMPQAVALVVGLTLLASAPIHAQFGALAKKAAKQAAERTVEKKIDKSAKPKSTNFRPSSAFGEELTESTFSALSRGLNAELAISGRRDVLNAQADTAAQGASRIRGQNDAEYSSYLNQASANRNCRDAAESKIEKRHEDEVEKKSADPRFTARYIELVYPHQEAISKAAQSRDTAAMNKATAGYNRAALIFISADSHADSAAVNQQCGPRPHEPAWLPKAKAAAAREDSLRVQVRALDGEIASAGATASGMPPEKYALAKERVLNWAYEENAFEEASGGSRVQDFGDAERKMFEAHKAEIKKFERLLIALIRTS